MTTKAAAERPLIDCARTGCRMRFYYVPGRGERARYCLDCADDVFGTRPCVCGGAR